MIINFYFNLLNLNRFMDLLGEPCCVVVISKLLFVNENCPFVQVDTRLNNSYSGVMWWKVAESG